MTEKNTPLESRQAAEAAQVAAATETTDDPRQGLPANVQLQLNQPTPYDLSKTTKSTDARGQYIQYDGVGTVRIMDAAAWKAAGVDSQDYFEWNYMNKKRIARSAFSDEQLQYLLRIDGRFSLVEDKPEAKKDN